MYRYYSYTRYSFLKRKLKMKLRYVDIGGQNLAFFFSEHSGKPIIFVHGLLDHSFGYRRLVPLIDKNYQVILVDIPGFGKSKFPKKIKFLYQVDVFAEMILNALRILDLQGVTLVGHSMGGLICQHIAILDKKRGFNLIDKLVLLSTGGIPHPKKEKIRSILFPKSERDVTRLLKYLYYEEFPEPDILSKKSLIHAWNKITYMYLAENTIEREEEIFLGRRASAIHIPTLIVSGKSDTITSPIMMGKINSYIENSELVLLEKAKHAIHIEKPHDVSHIINHFLEK